MPESRHSRRKGKSRSLFLDGTSRLVARLTTTTRFSRAVVLGIGVEEFRTLLSAVSVRLEHTSIWRNQKIISKMMLCRDKKMPQKKERHQGLSTCLGRPRPYTLPQPTEEDLKACPGRSGFRTLRSGSISFIEE